MMRIIFFISLVMISYVSACAQNFCKAKSPSGIWEQQFQQLIKQDAFKTTHAVNQSYVIPVIFHILYNTPQENIDSSRVNSAVHSLNHFFSDTSMSLYNAATRSIVAGNTNISFCLVKRDTNGILLQEPGINRINANIYKPDLGDFIDSLGFFCTPYIDTVIKSTTIWNPSKYFNVWVIPANNGLEGGYSTFPPLAALAGIDIASTGTLLKDGVVIFGTNPNLWNGALIVHEVGHYLGVRHISDTTCGNDYCNDTPPIQSNYGGYCNLSDTIYDIMANHMTYNSPHNFFSKDQLTRMQTALNNSPLRKNLYTNNLCELTTSINNTYHDKYKLEIAPNPFFDYLEIKLESINTYEMLNYTITDALGKVISQNKLTDTKTTIHTGNLEKGFYFLNITNDQGKTIKIEKLIK